MDLVLGAFDDAFLDKAWAHLMPLRLPVDELLRLGQNGTALLTDTLKPTSTLVKAAAATAYSNAVLYASSGEQQEWVTVSAWQRDDWRRQFFSVRGGSLCV
jgi:hypothetical protein